MWDWGITGFLFNSLGPHPQCKLTLGSNGVGGAFHGLSPSSLVGIRFSIEAATKQNGRRPRKYKLDENKFFLTSHILPRGWSKKMAFNEEVIDSMSALYFLSLIILFSFFFLCNLRILIILLILKHLNFWSHLN